MSGHPAQTMADQLKVMRQDEKNQRDHRIGTFLLEMIDQGQDTFTALDWGKRFHLSKTQYGNDIRRAVNLGLVIKNVTAVYGNGCHCFYRISNSIQEGIRSEDLTGMQKEYLRRLYDEFSGSEFRVEDMARLTQTGSASAQFHLSNFAERGILSIHRRPGKANLYIFAVTSEDHPECFAQISEPMVPSEKEKNKSEMALAAASATVLSASA